MEKIKLNLNEQGFAVNGKDTFQTIVKQLITNQVSAFKWGTEKSSESLDVLLTYNIFVPNDSNKNLLAISVAEWGTIVVLIDDEPFSVAEIGTKFQFSGRAPKGLLLYDFVKFINYIKSGLYEESK